MEFCSGKCYFKVLGGDSREKLRTLWAKTRCLSLCVRASLAKHSANATQTKISDLVQISPADLNKSSAEAIEDYINEKYSNKVVQKIGLCICLYDLLWASEGLIGHGTGIVNVNGK